MNIIKQLNKDIIKLVWEELKTNRLQVVNNFIAGLVVVALDFVFVWLTKQVIDIATGTSKLMTFNHAVILLVSTMVFQLVVTAWRSWINAMLNVKATNKMQLSVFRHAISMPWLHLQKYHSGDLVNRIEKDVNTIVGFVTDTLPSFVVVVAQFCGAFTFLYLMDKKLSFFVVIIIPFFLVLGKFYVNKMRKITRRIRSVDSRLQSQYQEGLVNNIIIKTLHNSFNVTVDRVVSIQNLITNLVRRRAVFSISSNMIVNIGFLTAYLFTFIWGTWHLSLGIITYGTLIAFVQLVAQIQRPARSLVKFVPELINLLTSGERLLEIRKIDNESDSRLTIDSSETSKIQELSASSIGIRLNNISFSYNDTKPILTNLKYDFAPGSRTLITAPTGRGKTTLIRLMLSLFAPQSGTIELYNKHTSCNIGFKTRKLFAYVPQGNTLFSGTIRSNLKVGAPNATDEELRRVLAIAKADFVNELPLGLSSQCGEKGVTLSEGQAQRLCIARTLLQNAPILLLDEATSALDIDTESQLLQNIDNACPDTTIIFISHRPKAREYSTGELQLN